MDYILRARFSLATERKPVNITAAVWKTLLWLHNMYPSLKYFMNSVKSHTHMEDIDNKMWADAGQSNCLVNAT